MHFSLGVYKLSAFAFIAVLTINGLNIMFYLFINHNQIFFL